MIVKTEVAIIGAGPYGLSLAAHLRSAGTDFRIIGHPMDAWRNHMPEGMLLKSDGFASNLYDPQGEYPLSRHCRELGIAYDDKRTRVRLDTFIDYGLAFARRFVPELTVALVQSLRREGNGFALRLDDGSLIMARRVVVAVGVERFKDIPEKLRRLGEQVSHSYDHRDLSIFTGRRIAVVGAGASAIDIAGLMRDREADVELICRADRLGFGGPPSPNDPSFWESLRNPSSGLGPGWPSRLCTDAPLLFYMGPAPLRLLIVEKHLGPFAAFVMKEKIEGRVPVHSGREIADAAVGGRPRPPHSARARRNDERKVIRPRGGRDRLSGRHQSPRVPRQGPSIRDRLCQEHAHPLDTVPIVCARALLRWTGRREQLRTNDALRLWRGLCIPSRRRRPEAEAEFRPLL